MKPKFIYTFIAMIFLAGFCLAQIPGGGPNNDRRWDRGRRERIEELRIWKMTEFLDLSPEQAENFFPVLKEHDEKIFTLVKEKKDLLEELYHESKSEDYHPSDEEISQVLNKLNKIDLKIETEKRRFIKENLNFLTNQQRVKYLLFDSRFKSHLLRALREHHNPKFEGEQ